MSNVSVCLCVCRKSARKRARFCDVVREYRNTPADKPEIRAQTTIRTHTHTHAHIHTCRTWFYYVVRGVKKDLTLTMSVSNMNPQTKMFNQGMKPCFRVGHGILFLYFVLYVCAMYLYI